MLSFEDYRIKEIISESKIIGFLKNLDKSILLCFYNSKTYKLFVFLNSSFKNIFLKNATKSLFMKIAKSVIKKTGLKDVGWFIVLVLLFNTLLMLGFKKEIDMFSICARVFFLILGLVLILRERR